MSDLLRRNQTRRGRATPPELRRDGVFPVPLWLGSVAPVQFDWLPGLAPISAALVCHANEAIAVLSRPAEPLRANGSLLPAILGITEISRRQTPH
ncbi:hypothetical protein N183_34990 [Sinorhizobium sp. Sb3]|nr:hypothetical protein N183_34990 [Sinorhizobium sp. Sb3]